MRAGTRARPRAMTRCDSNVDALVSGAPFSDKVMVFRSLYVVSQTQENIKPYVCKITSTVKRIYIGVPSVATRVVAKIYRPFFYILEKV